MLNYVPDFIVDQSMKKNLQGSFIGVAAFADITGFTRITQALSERGDQGIETLAKTVINDTIFDPCLEIIGEDGGMIGSFAGDAFTILFPERYRAQVEKTLRRIRQYFTDNPVLHTPLGDFDLKIKIGAACGEIHWDIYQSGDFLSYAFSGETLTRACICQQKQNNESINLDDSFFPSAIHATPATGISHIRTLRPHLPYSEDVKKKRLQFTQPAFRDYSPSASLRFVVTCFVRLNREALSVCEQTSAVESIMKLSCQYRGYCNKVDAGDKGLIVMVVFGVPEIQAMKQTLAADFAIEVMRIMQNRCSIGITSALSVFNGLVGNKTYKEYTALGPPVNMAARLLGVARWGEIFCCEETYTTLSYEYDFIQMPSYHLKNIPSGHHIYRLLDRRDHQASRIFRTSFIGRQEELTELQNKVLKMNDSDPFAMIMTGESGIGKTRLANEFLKTLNPLLRSKNRLERKIIMLTCKKMSWRPLHPVEDFLRSFFNIGYNNAQQGLGVIFGQESFREKVTKLVQSSLIQTGVRLFHEAQKISNLFNPSTITRCKQEIEDLYLYLESEVKQGKDSSLSHERIIQAIQVLFQLLIEHHGPLFLFIDDIHLADNAMMELIRLLMNDTGIKLWMLLSCRAEDFGNMLLDYKFMNKLATPVVDFSQESHYGTPNILLDQMNAQDQLDFIGETTRYAQMDETVKKEIIAYTGGNTLLMEQFSYYLLETGAFIDLSGLSFDRMKIRDMKLGDIVDTRLDQLNHRMFRHVVVASVLLETFDVRVLEELLQEEYDLDYLKVGENRFFWHQVNPGNPHVYAFNHLIMRDIIVHNQLLPGEVKELKTSAAESIYRVFQQDNLFHHYQEIARLYDEAGQIEKAIRFYSKAVKYETMRFDFLSALRYQERVLELSMNHFVEYSDENAEALLQTAIIYRNMGNVTKMQQHIQSVEMIIPHLTDPRKLQFDVDINKILYTIGMKDYASAVGYLKENLESDYMEAFPKYKAKFLHLMGFVYWKMLNLGEARKFLEEALEIKKYEYGIVQMETAETQYVLGLVLWHMGDEELAEKTIHQAIGVRHSEMVDQIPVMDRTLMDMGPVMSGEFDLSKTQIQLTKRYHVAGTDPHLITMWAEHLNGVKENLLVSIRNIEEQQLVSKRITATQYFNLGMVCFSLNQLEESLKHHRRALSMRESEDGIDQFDVGLSLLALGKVESERKDFDAGKKYLLQAKDIFDSLTPHPISELARVYLHLGTVSMELGDTKPARSYLEECLKLRQGVYKDYAARSPYIKQVKDLMNHL